MGKEERKALKIGALKIVKEHYFLLVVLMLFAGILGVTNSTFSNIMSFDFEATFGTSIAGVCHKIVSGDIAGAMELAADNSTDPASREVSLGHVQAGRTRGVFADIVNRLSSGSFFASLASVIFNIIDNPGHAGIICMLLALLLIGLEAVFVSEVFRIILARVLLEIRIYKHLNYSSFSFLVRTKKWFHVSIAYLRYNVFMFLWSFTIVGGFIKYYSYSMVKYILAENPSLTGKQAITLSQRMMKGHKWELFVFDLSFIGWYILDAITGSIAGLFFVVPYKQVARMEYYASLRARCKAEGMEGMELLFDDCLYEAPSAESVNEAYRDVLDWIDDPQVEIHQPTKIRAFFQNVFGVVLFYDKQEMAYRKSMAEAVHADAYEKIVKGEAYPVRLCPTPAHEKRKHMEHAYYMRHYSLTSLILIFFVFCFVGWIWEVTLHIVMSGKFVNRGVLQGPWLPIYGVGALMILLVLNKFRSKPVLEFILAIILCGGVEYFGSWALEVSHDGQRWWDYTGYFLNVNGRICAEGLLVFGLAGMAAVYFIAPILDNCFINAKERHLLPICATLVIVFIVDLIYSHFHPNTGEGITDYGEAKESVTAEYILDSNQAGL